MKITLDYTEFKEKLAERLSKVLSNSGLTQNELAQKLNLSQTAISNILSGRNGLSSQALHAIAVNFDINWNWLLLGQYSDQVMPGVNEKDEVYLIGKAKNPDELEACKKDVDFLKQQLKIQANYIKLLEEKLNS